MGADTPAEESEGVGVVVTEGLDDDVGVALRLQLWPFLGSPQRPQL